MYKHIQSIETENKAIIEQYKQTDFHKYSCEEMLCKMLIELGEISILDDSTKQNEVSESVQQYSALLAIAEILKIQGLPDSYQINVKNQLASDQLSLAKFEEFEEFWRDQKFGKAGFNWKAMENTNILPELYFDRKCESGGKIIQRKMNEAAILVEIFMKRLEELES